MPSTMDRSQRRFLLVLVILVSILFLWMVRSFLITLFLAAIFAAMAMPMHRLIRRKVGGRHSLAASFSLLILIIAFGIPLFGFTGLVANQAVEISSAARPWFENQIIELGNWDEMLERFPFLSHIFPGEGELLSKLSEFTAAAGRFLADSVVEVTRGTAAFSLQVFVMLYAMFFFLKDGPRILDRIFYYIPLPENFEDELVGRIVSVASVVLKGSLVIGIIQGGLAGAAFFLVGIPGWAFWTTVMIVLSLIPAVGSALVWIPAAVYLFSTGPMDTALIFTLWCVVVVGLVDNFLRPRLVGQGARMPDIMVLISTLGGIFLFGAVGLIIGPIIAALFLGILSIYGEMFADSLGEKPQSMRQEELEEVFEKSRGEASDEVGKRAEKAEDDATERGD